VELGGAGRPDVVGFGVSTAGSTDTGWERELTCGTHASARGEREDTEDGRHESKKNMYSVEYTKGACGPSRPMKGTVACGRGGPVR
jgi:hypothetical protein